MVFKRYQLQCLLTEPPNCGFWIVVAMGYSSISDSEILALDAQGFPGNDLDALRKIIRTGSVYLNVHTDAFPAGEVRGDLARRSYR